MTACSAPAAGRSWPRSRMSTCSAAASRTATYGVFYAARERPTAVAETRHHQAASWPPRTGPMHLPMRLYHVAIDAPAARPAPGRRVASAGVRPRRLRGSAGARGSLRAAGLGRCGLPQRAARGGQCVGLFRPRGASRCLHAAYLLYAWDGQRSPMSTRSSEFGRASSALRSPRCAARRRHRLDGGVPPLLRPQPLRPDQPAAELLPRPLWTGQRTASSACSCSAPGWARPWRWKRPGLAALLAALGTGGRLRLLVSIGSAGCSRGAGSASACCTAWR